MQEANTPKVKRQCFFQSTGAKIPIKPLKRGFIDEVDEIIKIYKSNQLPLLNSAGYKEVSMFLENKIKKDVLIEKIFFAHKKLAKHQRTWIKKIPNLKAFQSVDTAKNEIMEYLSH